MRCPRPVTESEAGCDAFPEVFGTYSGTCVKTLEVATLVGGLQSCLLIFRADV
jgi:hypothetical protein